MKLLIKNGRVINPATKMNEVKNVFVDNGYISYIGDNIPSNANEIIDASGCWVVPGLIDLHVHLREPGFCHKETILTGSRSAAMGGFTTVCCMPNTNPVIDSVELISYINIKSKEAGLIKVLPIASITKGQIGKSLSPYEKLKQAGACGISEDGRTVMSLKVMEKAMEEAKALDLTVFSHCEDHAIAGDGVMNKGYVSNIVNLKGIPKEAEETIIERDILLAEKFGTKLHLCHVSTKGAVQIIREAKLRGVQVTAEVCPHHFLLTEEAVLDKNPDTKMNPPLRSREDLLALLDGLKDGTIDAIATDHAPHHHEEKGVGFEKAPFGIVGLETALSLCISELVDKGILTAMELIEKLSYNPAKILGINGGVIDIGRKADLTIIDANYEYTIDKNNFLSKSKNTPFHGRKVKGRALYTIVDGKVVVRGGRLVNN